MTFEEKRRGVLRHLREIYDKSIAEAWNDRFCSLLDQYESLLSLHGTKSDGNLESHSAILITYGDSILDGQKESPLSTLHTFLETYVKDAISTVHILPFYPASSDDGFSVVDPTMVEPTLGSWDDIASLGKDYRLMFDFVANHLSRSNAWIQGALHDDPCYKDFVIEVEPGDDLRYVFRPRTLPLLTTIEGKSIWTTFSEDQIDVNYHNPDVLYHMVEVLLVYIQRGASIVRLDAVAFLWKEFGTNCLHHPKTHAIIRFFAWILGYLSPSSFLVTETNVPHRDNLSYFGNGHDEATMVYNFPLPPLVFHTLLSQDASALTSWAQSLLLPSKDVTFFNFLASHDGIGLMPVKGILDEKDIEAMADHAVSQGGFVSRKNESDGTTSPYELNINYFSALSNFSEGETEDVAIKRFVAASAIMIFFRGIPGIYIHSLVGSSNWYGDEMLKTQRRRINREKLDYGRLQEELSNPKARRTRILDQLLRLLSYRKTERAFSTTSEMQVPAIINPACFVFARCPDDSKQNLLVVINISSDHQVLPSSSFVSFVGTKVKDLMTGETMDSCLELSLQPYQIKILKHVEV